MSLFHRQPVFATLASPTVLSNNTGNLFCNVHKCNHVNFYFEMTFETVIFFVLIGMVYSDVPGECDMAGFYMELGCTAAPKVDNSSKCPDAFVCPDLHPDPKRCYYRGVPYNDRDMIPQSLVNNPCSQACSCTLSGEPRFQCAAVDCVQTFDTDLQQQCVYTYELDSCCYTGTVCGKDDVAKLKTCEIDGESYKEGQNFEPKNTRKNCICTPQWNGSIDNPAYCRDINCGIEIHYQDKLLDSCAPVFASNARSCPIAFQCPSPKSRIVRGINIRGGSTQCVFGNMTLAVGDEVTVDEDCTKCICQVPPFVTCTKQNSCDSKI